MKPTKSISKKTLGDYPNQDLCHHFVYTCLRLRKLDGLHSANFPTSVNISTRWVTRPSPMKVYQTKSLQTNAMWMSYALANK